VSREQKKAKKREERWLLCNDLQEIGETYPPDADALRKSGRSSKFLFARSRVTT